MIDREMKKRKKRSAKERDGIKEGEDLLSIEFLVSFRLGVLLLQPDWPPTCGNSRGCMRVYICADAATFT